MSRRYFNWKLAVVLLITVVVLTVTAYQSKQWVQQRRIARELEDAKRAYEEGEWRVAAAHYGRYITLVPDDANALQRYADAQLKLRPLKQGNIEHAITAYRTALRIDLTNHEIVRRLADIYLELDMPGEARYVTERYLEKNDSAILRRMYATALYNLNKVEQAVGQCHKNISLYPQDIPTYELLAIIVEDHQSDFTEDAVDWLNTAIENNPGSAQAYQVRAGYYLQNKQRDEAFADLAQAETLDLSDPSDRLAQARLYIQADDLDRARMHLEALGDDTNLQQYLWQSWADLAFKSDDPSLMANVASNGMGALAREPWDFMPIAAELLLNAGELEQAEKYLKLLRKNEIAPFACEFLEGFLAEARGNDHDAIHRWKRALEIDAGSAKCRFHLALALMRTGDNQSAAQHLRRLVSDHPTFLDARIDFANLLLEMGRLQEALDHSHAATQIAPYHLNAKLLYHTINMQYLSQQQIDPDHRLWRRLDDKIKQLEVDFGKQTDITRLRAQVAIRRNKLKKAKDLLDSLSQDQAAQTDVVLVRVEWLLADNNTDQAVQELTNLQQKVPDNLRVLRYLAAILTQQEQYEMLVNILQQSLQQATDRTHRRDIMLLLCEVYEQTQDENSRCTFVAACLEEFPSDIPLLCQRLSCEEVRNDESTTEELIKRIEAVEGEDGLQWRYQKSLYLASRPDYEHRAQEVIGLLKSNLKTNPGDQKSRILLGDTYAKIGRKQMAILTYTDAAALTPTDFDVVLPVTLALYRMGEYERANTIMKSAGEAGSHPQLAWLRIQGHLEQGQNDDAIEMMEQMLERSPEDMELRMAAAMLKVENDRFEGVEEMLEQMKDTHEYALGVASTLIELRIKQKRGDEALQLSNDLVEKRKDADAYLLRGHTLARLQRYEQAQKDFEQAKKIDPQNPDVWIHLAAFYESTNQEDKAIAEIQKALKVVGDDKRVRKEAAHLLLNSGDEIYIKQVCKMLEEVSETTTSDTELQLLLAQALVREKTSQSVEKAKTILRRIQQQNWQPQAQLLQGEIALLQGDFLDAVQIALAGLANRPDDKNLLRLKARAEAMQSPALALGTWQVIYSLDENDAASILKLAQSYIAAGRFDDAVKLLEKKMDSFNSEIQLDMKMLCAVAKYKMGERKEAVKKLQKFANTSEDASEALRTMGTLFAQAGDWRKLSELIKQWDREHPDKIRHLLPLARALCTIEDEHAVELAEQAVRGILRVDADCIEAKVLIAQLHYMHGHLDEAANLYESILAVQPNHTVAINNLAWILCKHQQQCTKALTLVKRGFNGTDENASLYHTRGVIFYELQQYDRAIDDLKKGVEICPLDESSRVSSYFVLAKAYAMKADAKTALEMLNKALELDKQYASLTMEEITKTRNMIEKVSEGF